MTRSAMSAAGLVALLLASIPSTARAQVWSATARVGKVTYDGTPAGASASSSVVLGLGRTAPRTWLGVSAALPLGADPFWAVLGGSTRLRTAGETGALLDLAGHGFLQRQNVGTTAPAPGPLAGPLSPPRVVTTDLSGEGAGGEVMAGAFTGSATARLETRIGLAAQRSRLGDVIQQRALPTGDARLTLVIAPVTFQAESRAWLDDSTTHAYAGGTLQYARGPVRVWGSAGEWVAGGRDGVSWSSGAGLAIGPMMELQLGARGNAFDPLYLTSTATSFWGGVSLRLGGSPLPIAPVPSRGYDGRAVIRIAAREATGTPSIAGDFTGWKPVAMQRDGSHWTFSAPLRPGVYHYAFVAEDGRWFVPASVPGRQSDGMGGETAVLVVS